MIDAAILHMYEFHAIKPEEMTTCMRLKIRESVHSYRDMVRARVLDEIPDISETLLTVT